MSAALRRWGKFNGVGLAGAAVQLAVVWLLAREGVAAAAAAAVGVEAAVLHNFAWHVRYTWRDRPAQNWREQWTRLGRFHAANGAVSILGNVALTSALHTIFKMPVVAANAASIVACSIVNYRLGDEWVFRNG